MILLTKKALLFLIFLWKIYVVGGASNKYYNGRFENIKQ